MRRRAQIDGNQPQIVRALRQVGASVVSLASVGDGCPDLLVGFRNRNHLLEVKDGSRKPSERRLTPDEARWHAAWEGQVVVVECEEDALQTIGVTHG